MPRRKGDILKLPGVGPALGQILVTVFGAWDEDNTGATVMRTDADQGDPAADPHENDHECSTAPVTARATTAPAVRIDLEHSDAEPDGNDNGDDLTRAKSADAGYVNNCTDRNEHDDRVGVDDNIIDGGVLAASPDSDEKDAAQDKPECTGAFVKSNAGSGNASESEYHQGERQPDVVDCTGE